MRMCSALQKPAAAAAAAQAGDCLVGARGGQVAHLPGEFRGFTVSSAPRLLRLTHCSALTPAAGNDSHPPVTYCN